jgi:hypothetical protein
MFTRRYIKKNLPTIALPYGRCMAATAETGWKAPTSYVNDKRRGARLSFEMFAHHVIAITSCITEPLYKKNRANCDC